MAKGINVGGPIACGYCDQSFTLISYRRIHVRKRHQDRLTHQCDYCTRVYETPKGKQSHQGWAHAEYANGRNDPVRQRDWNLRSKYGIGIAEYQELLEQQRGRCAGCGAMEGKGDRNGRLHVDHCHATGRVRGLLCTNCNHAIGKTNDSPDLLRRLAAYLEADRG